MLPEISSAADEALADKVTMLQKEVNELQLELTNLKAILKKLDDKSNVINQLRRETIILDQDKLTLKSGYSSIELTKEGNINLKGKAFNVHTSSGQDVNGSKINGN